MTGRERILALLAGETPDHIPVMPITMMFAAGVLGVPYGQYARDHRVMAEAQLKTAETFGFDYVSSISDPAREAADAGARIQWFDDQPPAIVEEDALFADKSALARAARPQPFLRRPHGRPHPGHRTAPRARCRPASYRGLG